LGEFLFDVLFGVHQTPRKAGGVPHNANNVKLGHHLLGGLDTEFPLNLCDTIFATAARNGQIHPVLTFFTQHLDSPFVGVTLLHCPNYTL
jgi:hypothetical protein